LALRRQVPVSLPEPRRRVWRQESKAQLPVQAWLQVLRPGVGKRERAWPQEHWVPKERQGWQVRPLARRARRERALVVLRRKVLPVQAPKRWVPWQNLAHLLWRVPGCWALVP
jgi:hypothetical protein